MIKEQRSFGAVSLISTSFWSCGCQNHHIHNIDEEQCVDCGVRRDESRKADIVYILNHISNHSSNPRECRFIGELIDYLAKEVWGWPDITPIREYLKQAGYSDSQISYGFVDAHTYGRDTFEEIATRTLSRILYTDEQLHKGERAELTKEKIMEEINNEH